MSTIYLELDPEIAQQLAAQRLSIADLLEQANVDAQTSYAVLPQDEEQTTRSKDLVPIILASGASIAVVISSLAYAFRQFVRRPHMVEIEELEELRDSKGNILFDQAGKPLFKRSKRWHMLEPQKADSKTDLEINVGLSGAVMKFSTTESQRDQPTTQQQP